MKRLLFVLSFLLPSLLFAQNENKSKYNEFLSTSKLITTVTYSIPEVVLTAAYGEGKYTEKVSFSIEKMSNDKSSSLFLVIRHNQFDNASYVILESADVKELYASLKQIQDKSKTPKPEDAVSIVYTYMGNSGLSVKYEKDWTIQLERYNKDKIWVSDIEPLCQRLNEIIQQMETLK